MALQSLADSCRLLAIDAKALRRWLGLAHLSVQAHPLDARLKCVTNEHIQHLAAIHHRALPPSSALLFSALASASSTSSEGSQASVWSSVGSEVSGPISALTQQLSSLLNRILPSGLLGSRRFLLFVLLARVAISRLFVGISPPLARPGGHIARFTAILNGVASV